MKSVQSESKSIFETEIVYRLWNDADEDQILNLVRCGYGDMEIAYADYFDWEYRRNPAGRATIGVGQLSDGRVVTALATVPTPVIFKGTRTMASQLVNGVTHPDFRGKELFPKCSILVWNALEKAGIALSYGFPNPRSFPGLTRKVGYADIGRARLLLRPYAPAELLSTRFPAARWFGLGGLDRVLARSFLKKPKRKMTVEIKPSFEGLSMEHLHEETKLAVAPDIEWLNWRYVEIPRRQYRIITVGGDVKPLGVAVYRIASWDSLKIGTLNDIFLAPDCDLGVVENLVHHIFTDCEASDCAATFCLVSPGSRKLEILKAVGFCVVPSRFEPQPFSVILRGHTISVSDITVADMEVSFGAYDIF